MDNPLNASLLRAPLCGANIANSDGDCDCNTCGNDGISDDDCDDDCDDDNEDDCEHINVKIIQYETNSCAGFSGGLVWRPGDIAQEFSLLRSHRHRGSRKDNPRIGRCTRDINYIE